MSGTQQHIIEQDKDEHLFIMINHEGAPTISIDINGLHGRRSMSVRLDGMTHLHFLVDAAEIGITQSGTAIQRFCPYCGEEKNPIASVDRHKCPIG